MIYFLFLRNLCNNDLLINYWSDAFLPNLQLSTLNIKWLIISFFDILKNQVGLYFNGIAGLAFLIGSISMLSGNNKIFYVLMLPVLLVLIASGFRLYPFNGRLLLFIVPSFVLIISEGSEYIREKTKNNATIIWFIIICLLFLPQVGKAILIPYYKEEIRSVVNYISENEKNGDKLYLYYGSIPAYKYYSAILNINNKSYIEGKEGRDNWRIYIDDINKLRGNKRVWILFSHVGNGEGVDEEKFFIYYLNIIGDNLEKFKSPGASVYLYNLYK